MVDNLSSIQGVLFMTFRAAARFCYVLVALGLIIVASGRGAEAQVSLTTFTENRQDLGWSPPQNVSRTFSADSEAPALAVTDEGVVHVVWEEGDELQHSYRVDGSWSTPSPISGTGNGEQPALASGRGNQVHLVYVNDSELLYVSWNGSTWGASRNVSQTTGVSDSPDLAVAPDDSVHLVAVEQVGGDTALYYANSGDGTAWPFYTPIPSAYGQSPSIDVTGTPTPTVQIAYRESLITDIYTLKRVGGTWTVPEAVTNAPEAFSTAPELILDDAGEAHVAWRETIDGTPQVQYTRGPTWTPVITLSQSATGASLPGLAFDTRGRIHAAWGDGAYPSFALLHTWSNETASWRETEPVDSGDLEMGDVVLSGATNGTVHGIWVEGSTGEIWHASWPQHRVLLPLVLKH